MCAADYAWPFSKRVSSDCKDLVSKILVVDTSKRITVQEIQVRQRATHVFPGCLGAVHLSLSKTPSCGGGEPTTCTSGLCCPAMMKVC